MRLKVTDFELSGPHQLSLTFNDGTSGLADLEPLLDASIFVALRDAEFFARVELDRVCGTVVWPNGADFAPEALHALIGVEAAAKNKNTSLTLAPPSPLLRGHR